MNNTDKLLRAFIEAQGYEIEETTSKCSPLESNERDFFGNYIKTDYKVTKKDKQKVEYDNLNRAMSIVFDIDITPDEFLALGQLMGKSPSVR